MTEPDPRAAAADWKRAYRAVPISSDPLVVFAAPLMSRAMADDWGAVSRAVARAVASLRAQTDPNWKLLICSQDRPEGIDFDERVIFLPFDRPAEGFDKKPKVERLCAALPDHVPADGYLFAFDADDVVHPDLVRWIRADHNGRGYWLRDGYMIDAATGAVGTLGPRRPWAMLRRPFIAQCGSSAALYVDFRTDRGFEHVARRFYRPGHRDFRANAAAHGLPLARVPFPAALYVMNTGENMRQKRGKLDRKLVQLDRARLSDTGAGKVRAEFGWDRL